MQPDTAARFEWLERGFGDLAHYLETYVQPHQAVVHIEANVEGWRALVDNRAPTATAPAGRD